MDVTNQTDDEQARLWNGHAGRAWGEAQEVLDQMLRPFEDLPVQAACAAYGGRVLDVGCGTGSTTLAVARRLGAKGRCIGVDISGPMIAAARAANLRRAAKDDAEFRFIAWRSASENPFMTTAERAAAPLLPNLPSRRPD